MSDFHPGSVRSFPLFAYVSVVYIDIHLKWNPAWSVATM